MPIIAEIAKEFRFEAAHFLPAVPPEHQCHKMHGHSYKLTIRLTGPIDEHQGWVMDLADLSKAFEPLAKQLDHALLNNIPGLENPTGELVALWIYKNLEKTLPLLTSISLEATSRISITINKSLLNN